MQALTQSVSAADGAQSAPALWRTVLGVFKLRIGVIIALTAMAGISVQPGTGLSAAQVTAVFVAVLLASASAGAFNQYYEADLDRHMRRTRARAFAAGRLARHPVWLPLIVLLGVAGVALAWMATNGAAALFTFLGAFFYAVVYTVWLKRRTWWNIVIGGMAGSFGVLAGAAAVAPELSPRRWRWQSSCSCGHLRTSGAWRSSVATTTSPPVCRCSRRSRASVRRRRRSLRTSSRS